MRNKLIVLSVLALLVVALPAATVFAQSATNQTWTSSITYYTPSTTSGTLQVDYYGSDGTKYSANPRRSSVAAVSLLRASTRCQNSRSSSPGNGAESF